MARRTTLQGSSRRLSLLEASRFFDSVVKRMQRSAALIGEGTGMGVEAQVPPSGGREGKGGEADAVFEAVSVDVAASATGIALNRSE